MPLEEPMISPSPNWVQHTRKVGKRVSYTLFCVPATSSVQQWQSPGASDRIMTASVHHACGAPLSAVDMR